MNLREDKHWSYGAGSGAQNALGQRLWTASAPVQIDKTIDAIKEMQREVSDFATGKATTTAEELSRVQSIFVRTLPGSLETAEALLGLVGDMNRYGFPDDYIQRRTKRIGELTPPMVQSAAKTLQPASFTWVIVGDLAKIEAGVRALNLGTVQVIDADGKPVSANNSKVTLRD